MKKRLTLMTFIIMSIYASAQVYNYKVISSRLITEKSIGSYTKQSGTVILNYNSSVIMIRSGGYQGHFNVVRTLSSSNNSKSWVAVNGDGEKCVIYLSYYDSGKGGVIRFKYDDMIFDYKFII